MDWDDNLLSMDSTSECRSLPVFIVSEFFLRITGANLSMQADQTTSPIWLHDTYRTCEQAPTTLKALGEARANVVVSSESSESLRNAAG